MALEKGPAPCSVPAPKGGGKATSLPVQQEWAQPPPYCMKLGQAGHGPASTAQGSSRLGAPFLPGPPEKDPVALMANPPPGG